MHKGFYPLWYLWIDQLSMPYHTSLFLFIWQIWFHFCRNPCRNVVKTFVSDLLLFVFIFDIWCDAMLIFWIANSALFIIRNVCVCVIPLTFFISVCAEDYTKWNICAELQVASQTNRKWKQKQSSLKKCCH